eukprot:1154738-Pelagomonas_calceolata.AAC.2
MSVVGSHLAVMRASPALGARAAADIALDSSSSAIVALPASSVACPATLLPFVLDTCNAASKGSASKKTGRKKDSAVQFWLCARKGHLT